MNRLALTITTLALLLGLGCATAETTGNGLLFQYTPAFTSYSGGTGSASNPLSGAWRLQLNGSSGGLIPAETYYLIPQAFSNSTALGFVPSPTRRANIYLEAHLSGGNLQILFRDYDAGQNRVAGIVMDGLYDIGLGSVSSGNYQAQVDQVGSARRAATGTWSLDVAQAPLTSPDFLPFPDGSLNSLSAILVDHNGTGDTELYGNLTLDVDGTDVTGVFDAIARDEAGATLGSGTLDVTGSRLGGILTLNIDGDLDGVAVAGEATITVVELGNSSPFPGDELGGGVMQLETGATGGNLKLRNLDFGGIIGRTGSV